MNKQGSKEKPSGGIEWAHWFGPGTGWTANPVRGCKHECQWRMPDGRIAICYAKRVAHGVAAEHFPRGFTELSFHPSELDAIEAKTDPCGIFLDSMSDLFGSGVAHDWIERTLMTVRKCPQHVFFTLTKNAPRLLMFGDWPANLLVGVSAPPTYMFGKLMTLDKQLNWFDVALGYLHQCGAPNRWVSLEPLSFDLSKVLANNRKAFHWAVIGAASNGSEKHQPAVADMKAALAALAGLPVFYKGNIAPRLSVECGGWRAEFPKLRGVQKQEEMAL
jgi:Bacteriophage protein gp37